MKTTTKIVYNTLALLALICCPLSPLAQALVPPPDGGYPGGNTAEGQSALFSLTTGTFNTGVGFLSLESNGEASLNTALGAGSLLSNTADDNTATGAGALLNNTTGTFNTANGTFALVRNIEGDNNTAIGSFALQDNTGDANTATGAFALQHNTTGFSNTATGVGALLFNTEGSLNTGIGVNALVLNTTGASNTAAGCFALFNNTTGQNNTAIGTSALSSNTASGDNTASGFAALHSNTGGGNTATGSNALSNNASGDQNTADGVSALGQNTIWIRNTAVGAFALSNSNGDFNTAFGFDAGLNVTTASNVICIGANVAGFDVSDSCFIGNIYQKQVGGDSLAVRVDSSGKLGTEVSSRRFKRDIKPMDHASAALLALRPVTFSYNSDSTNTVQFGLIAEEVAKVDSNLVVLDKERKPYSVRYDQVNAMLLNEFLKEHKTVQELKKEIAALRATVRAQVSKIQRISNQLELNKPSPQLVHNNQ